MKIAIIDFGMGNLYSVQNACKHVELDPKTQSLYKNIQIDKKWV